MLSLITLIHCSCIMLSGITAKEYLAYKYSVVDKEHTQQMVSILTDTTLEMGRQEVLFDSSLQAYSKFKEYLWGHLELLPSYYDTPYDSLPDLCLSYMSSHKTRKKLLFQKIEGKINTSLDSFLFGVKPGELSSYRIERDCLLIETRPSEFEYMFKLGSHPTGYQTSFGKTVFLKHYQRIHFFKRDFSDIFEFFYMVKFGPSTYEFIIWFDSNYDLVRIEGQGYGYVLDNS